MWTRVRASSTHGPDGRWGKHRSAFALLQTKHTSERCRATCHEIRVTLFCGSAVQLNHVCINKQENCLQSHPKQQGRLAAACRLGTLDQHERAR